MNDEIVRRNGAAEASGAQIQIAVPGANGEEMHRRHALAILWRGRWFILVCGVLAVAGGLFYLSKQTLIYSSSSRVLVEPDVKIIAGDQGGAAGRSGNYLQTQCELLMSAKILGPVAALPEVGAMRTFANVDNPIGLLRAGINAQVGQKDDLITVSFESPFPAEAASIVNAVVDSYKTYQGGKKRDTSAELLKLLIPEKRDRDAELRGMAKKMLEFKQKNPNLSFTSEKGNIIIEQLARLSESLTTTHMAVLDARAAYDASRAVAGDPARRNHWLRMVKENPQNPLVAEAQHLEIDMSTVGRGMMAEHVTRKAQTSRLSELRSRIDEQAEEAFQSYIAETDQNWQAMKNREAELQHGFAEQQKLALSLNTQSTEYAMLESDATRMEKLCDQLDTRIKELEVNEGTGSLNISVLEDAKPSLVPIKPKRSTTLFQALVMGLFAGCGLAYLRDWADQRLSSVEEVQARLRLGVLGVLPHMSDRETPSVRGQKVQLDPMSDIAEAYRTVRTSVFFGAPEDKAKTILITSPTSGDGKTTTTSNLAIAMAQTGQRVLLLDCDFRKPMQHRIFGIEDGIGVSDVVAGRKPLSQAVKLTNVRNLYVLPAGTIPGNPSEILHGEMFARILAKLVEKFDHVIIDAPPVIPVTDARILAASADLTILILRAQKSTRRVSEQACESLRSVGGRLLGVVINDVPRRRGSYGYYSYGYYHQRYGGKAAAREMASLPATNGNGKHPDEVGATSAADRD